MESFSAFGLRLKVLALLQGTQPTDAAAYTIIIIIIIITITITLVKAIGKVLVAATLKKRGGCLTHFHEPLKAISA